MLSGKNREVPAEANQILSEAGCSLIFTPNEYYAGSWTPLFIDCRTVADGHIHGGRTEFRNSGMGFKSQSLALLQLDQLMLQYLLKWVQLQSLIGANDTKNCLLLGGYVVCKVGQKQTKRIILSCAC